MNDEQKKAMRKIAAIAKEHFSHALVAVVFPEEGAFKIEIAQLTASPAQSLHLARRILNEVEIATTGLIRTPFTDDPNDVVKIGDVEKT